MGVVWANLQMAYLGLGGHGCGGGVEVWMLKFVEYLYLAGMDRALSANGRSWTKERTEGGGRALDGGCWAVEVTAGRWLPGDCRVPGMV